MHYRFLAMLVSLVLVQTAGAAQDFDEQVSRIVVANGFSGTVLVSRGGKVAYERAVGLADREARKTVTLTTRFQVGSVSKWITVIAALKLVDAGKLSLQAPITRYLKDYPKSIGDRITVADVLSNMSGLKDRLPTSLANDPAVAASTMTAAQAVKLYAYGPLVTKPGSTFDYAHTNWVLAQAILESASGIPLEKLLQGSLFEPFGLADTGVTRGSFIAAPNSAVAYESSAVGAKRDVHILPAFLIPTGTIYSTTHDLARLAHVVYETDALSRSARTSLLKVRYRAEDYALGGRVRRVVLGGHWQTVASEVGSIGGFKAVLVHVVGNDVSVVILNNTNMSQDVLTGIADRMLEVQYASSSSTGHG